MLALEERIETLEKKVAALERQFQEQLVIRIPQIVTDAEINQKTINDILEAYKSAGIDITESLKNEVKGLFETVNQAD